MTAIVQRRKGKASRLKARQYQANEPGWVRLVHGAEVRFDPGDWIVTDEKGQELRIAQADFSKHYKLLKTAPVEERGR